MSLAALPAQYMLHDSKGVVAANDDTFIIVKHEILGIYEGSMTLRYDKTHVMKNVCGNGKQITYLLVSSEVKKHEAVMFILTASAKF